MRPRPIDNYRRKNGNNNNNNSLWDKPLFSELHTGTISRRTCRYTVCACSSDFTGSVTQLFAVTDSWKQTLQGILQKMEDADFEYINGSLVSENWAPRFKKHVNDVLKAFNSGLPLTDKSTELLVANLAWECCRCAEIKKSERALIKCLGDAAFMLGRLIGCIDEFVDNRIRILKKSMGEANLHFNPNKGSWDSCTDLYNPRVLRKLVYAADAFEKADGILTTLRNRVFEQAAHLIEHTGIVLVEYSPYAEETAEAETI